MTTASDNYERILTKRAILSALGPMAGTRATGTVTATASGDPVVLPPFTYGVPIIDGKAVYARMLKTLPSTPLDEEPEGTTVTSAGTAISVRAVCGGVAGNLPAGTKILWQPLPSGILARGTVTAGGITGGIAASGPGRCARVVALDMLGREEATRTVWQAQGEGFPALIVSRVGSTVRQLRSVASAQRAHTFRVFVVSTNYESADERQGEAEILLDQIEDILQGLADVEGEVFSGPPCEVGQEVAMAFAPSSHVFAIDVTASYSKRRTDVRLTDGVSWQPWETSQLQVAEPATDTQDGRAVVDVTVEHEQ